MATIDRCISASESDFWLLAPEWTRETIERAIAHGDQPLPPYAVKSVDNALRVVSKVNAKGKHDFEAAAAMPRAHRKGVTV